jgi:hypothetical protein
MGLEGDDLPGVKSTAWYVAGTWAITGESAGRLDRGAASRTAGRLELAARLEQIRFDDIVYRARRSVPQGISLLGNTISPRWSQLAFEPAHESAAEPRDRIDPRSAAARRRAPRAVHQRGRAFSIHSSF